MKALTRSYACNVTLRNVRLTVFSWKSNKYCIFWECVFVALVMQHIKRKRHIIFPSLTVWLYTVFPHYLIIGTIFGKKLLSIKCVFWFSLQLLYEKFIILRRTRWSILINVNRSLCKVSVILVRFWWNLYFLETVSKNTEISNWEKIGPERVELFHASRRTKRQTWRSY